MTWNKLSEVSFADLAKYNELPYDYDHAGEFTNAVGGSEPVAGGGIALGQLEHRSLGGKLRSGTGAGTEVSLDALTYTAENASLDDESKHCFWHAIANGNRSSSILIPNSQGFPFDIKTTSGELQISDEYTLSQMFGRPRIAGRQRYNVSASSTAERQVFITDNSYTSPIQWLTRSQSANAYRSRRYKNSSGVWTNGNFTISDTDLNGYNHLLHDGFVFHHGHISRYELDRVAYGFSQTTTHRNADVPSGQFINLYPLDTDGNVDEPVTYFIPTTNPYSLLVGYIVVARVMLGVSSNGFTVANPAAQYADDVGWDSTMAWKFKSHRLGSSRGTFSNFGTTYTGEDTQGLFTGYIDDNWNPKQQVPDSVFRRTGSVQNFVDPQENHTYYGCHSCTVYIELTCRYVFDIFSDGGSVTYK